MGQKLGVRLDRETWDCLKLLCYWPLYGVVFFFAERVFRPERFHVMHCWLDDLIPFCEVFLIPYLFWFAYLIGIHVYTFFCDRRAFQNLMRFIILSYTIGLVIFFAYPNCQLLRPSVFPRDNMLTQFMASFYRFDTHTNVFPSLHVVGSMAVWYAARDTSLFENRNWRLFFHLSTLLISVSTVFLKQHSALDLMGGVVVSVVSYGLVYRGQELQEAVCLRRSRRKFSW